MWPEFTNESWVFVVSKDTPDIDNRISNYNDVQYVISFLLRAQHNFSLIWKVAFEAASMELLLEGGLNGLIRYTTLKYMKTFNFFNEHGTSVLEILFDVVNLKSEMKAMRTHLCSELVYVSFL